MNYREPLREDYDSDEEYEIACKAFDEVCEDRINEFQLIHAKMVDSNFKELNEEPNTTPSNSPIYSSLQQ